MQVAFAPAPRGALLGTMTVAAIEILEADQPQLADGSGAR
jgi:hypothetical protein